MRNKNRSKQEMSNQKISKQKDSKLGRKGLEVGKRFRTRFWEGLFWGKHGEPALKSEISSEISPKINPKISHKNHTTHALNPRGDNKNNINNKSNVNNKSGVVWDNNRTRIWEGGYLNFFSIIIFIISILLISLLSLSLVVSQTNESNQTNPSNLSNETNLINKTNLSNGINESVEGLGVKLNEFSALENELDNLTSELINNG